jgi:hypothetical protein
LPVRPPRDDDAGLAPFEEPEGAAPLEAQVLRTASRDYTIQHDVVRNIFQLIDGRDGGSKRIIANGLEYETHNTNIYTIIEDDPLSAQVRCDRMISVGREDWHIRIETTSTMTADAETFYVTNLLEAYEGTVRVFAKSWDFAIPRDLV